MTEASLAMLAALWVNCLLYRREAFCLLEHAFHWLSKLRDLGRKAGAKILPASVRDELGVLALLQPLIGTDQHAAVHPELCCTDARGGPRPRAGACRATVHPDAARELWRLRMRRGGDGASWNRRARLCAG